MQTIAKSQPQQASRAAMPEAFMQNRTSSQAVYQIARDRGLSSLCATLLACRLQDAEQAERFLEASLSKLDDPEGLPDIDAATARILRAIASQEFVLCVGDHDADGLQGLSILHSGFRLLGHPADRLGVATSHRLTEGYGLNEAVANRILALAPRPTLLITADHGSSDEARIARLVAAGIEVIVTDHHNIPAAGPPRSALACVNPVRNGFAYPDPFICGGMVAWLLMANVRRAGVGSGQFAPATPKLNHLLAMAAISTVADCVNLASPNNRAVVRAGLQLLRSSQEPYCQAIRNRLGGPDKPINEETIGFQIAPRLAAHGRLDDAMPGLHFLLSETVEEAVANFDILTAANEERKEIQRELTQRAMVVAADQVAAGRLGLAIHFADGMAGVHGITSSRITEVFGLPSAMMSPVVDQPELVSVSMRSVEGVHLKQLLEQVAADAPGLLVSHGGHAAAAGARLRLADVPRFQELFDVGVKQRAPDLTPGRRLPVDGPLTAALITATAYDEIHAIGPFGRGFEAPQFSATFRVRSPRLVGAEGVHLQFQAQLDDGTLAKAIYFHAVQNAGDGSPLRDGDLADGVFRLSENNWNGRRRIELQCVHARAVG